MPRLDQLVLSLTIVLSIVSIAEATELKIGSWNIANLAEKPGVPLRGHIRTKADYTAIKNRIKSLDFDILALQEIGSLTAAKAILPKDYSVHFEERCLNNSTKCENDVGDIFTAIAFKTKKFPGIKREHIANLDIKHQSECSTLKPRRVRGAPFLRFKFEGKRYVVPSLHLKASCSKNSNESRPDIKYDCKTQRAQVDRLLAWAQEADQSGHTLILAGDWNRELLTDSDNIRKKITSVYPTAQFEPKNPRICWTDFHFDFGKLRKQARKDLPEISAAGFGYNIYTPRSANDIDFFVMINLDKAVAPVSKQIILGKSKRLERPNGYIETCPPKKPKPFGDGKVLVFTPAHPSDHCPISLTLTPKS